MSQINKPSIGIIPENIWKGRRLNDINDAIIRYIKDNSPLPVEWITERNRLLKELTE